MTIKSRFLLSGKAVSDGRAVPLIPIGECVTYLSVRHEHLHVFTHLVVLILADSLDGGLLNFGGKPGAVAPGKKGLQESSETEKTICAHNARTLASKAAIVHLVMRAKKAKHDDIGPTETRRRRPLNAVHETRTVLRNVQQKKSWRRRCPSQHVYSNKNRLFRTTNDPNRMLTEEKMQICASFNRIRRSHSNIALGRSQTFFFMDLDKFYGEDNIFYNVTLSDFNVKIGPRRTPEEHRIGT
ncbi:hypothetical protein RB195_023285 [Necator americanus]|uniref:Uncharacterized protein n=1 Tax=Necator americanus TaxID=51031 RepID=A0ABR1EII3_NECAM